MLKKLILGTLFVGLIAVLVIGAINRTVDKNSDGIGDHSPMADARGNGQGQGRLAGVANQETNVNQGAGYQGGRSGQSSVDGLRQYPNYQEAPEEWVTYEGTVAQLPASGVDLIVDTVEGEVVVGTGPLDLATQGMPLSLGDQIQVNGYWEDDEFKAGTLSLVATGESITLRDELGRPSWSGAGRNSQGQNISTIANNGNRGAGANGRNNVDVEQAGQGQADVTEWLSVHGVVKNLDETTLLIITDDGVEITMMGRPWSFAREQGFSASVDDEVSLFGFYENGEFEVGRIDNLTGDQTVSIRQDSGRPLWAGGWQS